MNENTNGLIWQSFPKNRDFTTITQQEINMAMVRLNNRPRKRLGSPQSGILQTIGRRTSNLNPPD
jgi:IS30 family transposase